MLGMETIWKNSQSGLDEPESKYLQVTLSVKKISGMTALKNKPPFHMI